MAKIIYEPHPVTPERKAELRAQGYKVMDARFDPSPKDDNPVEETGIDAMNKTQVREWLDEREIEHDGRASADELRALAKEHES